jgi:hypothetical protein
MHPYLHVGCFGVAKTASAGSTTLTALSSFAFFFFLCIFGAVGAGFFFRFVFGRVFYLLLFAVV